MMRTQSTPRKKVREKSPTPKKGVSGEHHCAKWHVTHRHKGTEYESQQMIYTVLFLKRRMLSAQGRRTSNVGFWLLAANIP